MKTILKENIEIRDIHEIKKSDLLKIEKNIYNTLNSVYVGPFKHLALLDIGLIKKKGNKLIQAGIPLQFYENYSILEENGVDRVSKVFYINGAPCGIITYKISLQKEHKYLDMLANNNLKTENGYVELKGFFAFEGYKGKGLGSEMMKEMFKFFKFTLGKYDGVLVTVNKKKLEYVYSFFLKYGFVDIGCEKNIKTDNLDEKSEHILYFYG